MSVSKKKSSLSDWNRVIGTVIAATRSEAGVTQEELAKLMGWHRSKVVKIESAKITMRLAELILVAKALKVDPETLFRRIVRW